MRIENMVLVNSARHQPSLPGIFVPFEIVSHRVV